MHKLVIIEIPKIGKIQVDGGVVGTMERGLLLKIGDFT